MMVKSTSSKVCKAVDAIEIHSLTQQILRANYGSGSVIGPGISVLEVFVPLYHLSNRYNKLSILELFNDSMN